MEQMLVILLRHTVQLVCHHGVHVADAGGYTDEFFHDAFDMVVSLSKTCSLSYGSMCSFCMIWHGGPCI